MPYEYSHTEQGATPLNTTDVYRKTDNFTTTAIPDWYYEQSDYIYVNKVDGIETSASYIGMLQ